MSELEQLEAFFLSIESERLDATPDEDYDPEEEQDLLDEQNNHWYASRGV